MTSVWKRLQRVGKKAAKFQFAASFQELVIESTKKWQPDKLRVVWIRRNRRHCTKLHSWQPGIKNPYRGLVVWQAPESLDITVTLFKEPTAEEFEDKDWTFVIENETKGHRKVLASVDVNMKKFASATPAQYNLTLKLKPLSVKVVEATLKLSLSCIFLKEGKATDEDMQSLASLMSMKQSDIGNLDDFNDSDDEAGEDRKATSGSGQVTHVTASATRIHDLAWRPAIESGPKVTSEMDWKTSSGISSTILAPSCPPLPEPPDPSIPSFLRTCLPSTTQQSRPSPYAYSLPAFTRAHPPALPKIFQPSAGSVPISAPRRPHSFHSGVSPAEGLEVQAFSTFSSSKTSSLSSSTSDPSLHSPTACDTSQTVVPSAWCAPRIPSFFSISSSTSSIPLSSFHSIPPPPAPRQPKARLSSVGEAGSVLTRPTSLPSAPETVSWQSEWRPPKSQAPLAQPALSPKLLHLTANDSGQPTVLQKKQRIEMPSSFSLTTGPSLEQKPQGECGYVSSWKPQVNPAVETPSPSPLNPASSLLLCGPPPPPLPPQPHISQTALVSPSDQDAEFKRQLSTLSEEDNQCTKPTTPDPRAPANRRHELPRTTERKRDAHFGLEVVKASAGPESMASLLPLSPRKTLGLKYFEMPKPHVDETESRPKRTFPNIQSALPPISSHKQNPDFQDHTSASAKEPLLKPRSHLSKMSIQLGNPIAHPEPVQYKPLSPTKPQPTSRSLQGPVLHLPSIATPPESKLIGRIAHKKEAVSMDLGNESMAVSCVREASSACPSVEMSKTPGAQSGEWSIAENSQLEKPKRDTQKISPAVPIPAVDEKIICNTVASDQTTSGLDSQKATNKDLSEQREESKREKKGCDVHSLKPEHCMEKKGTENIALSMDKRALFEKDKRVAQELALTSTAVSTKEKCVYISTVELAPFCPRGSSSSPSTSVPEARLEGTVREPQLQSSCPEYSKIPGMPCLHQAQVVAWSDDRMLLFQRLSHNRVPLLLYSDHVRSLYKRSAGIAQMGNLTLSCSRSASIPGFPSALKHEPNMAHLLPTCPRFCRVPGLASAGSVTGYGKRYWDRCSLWEKPVRIKEAWLLHVSCVQEQAVCDTEMIKVMVAMLPTCSRKASIPGFPSAPFQKASNTPSMASLLPTCPKQTRIAGMPFRQRLMACNDSWHILREFIFDRPLRSNPALVQENPYEDKEHVKYMVDILPSCPWKTTISSFASSSQKEPDVPGVPFTQSEYPRMADFLPTCPSKARVIGLPSKEPVIAQVGDFSINKHVLMEKPLSLLEVLKQDYSPVASQNIDEREMFGTVTMLPLCPVRTCLVAKSPGPQNYFPSIVSLVPVCPKQTQTPGMPSRDQNNSNSRYWHASRKLIDKRPEKTTQAYIVQWIPKDTDVLKGMVDMLVSCPQKAKVFGLPSAPRQEPIMVNLLPSCPRQSGVCGLPSKTGQNLCLLSCSEWFAYESLQWEKPLIKREVQILNAALCCDKNNAENMSATLPSCPNYASVPGFPSALTLTSADGLTMVNFMPTCTKESRVPGLPIRNTTQQLEWLLERKSLQLPRDRSGVTLYSQDVFYLHCDMIVNMVSILPSCPRTACLPGFTSVSCPQWSDIPSMIRLLPTLPEHSRVHGIQSRICSEFVEAEWNIDERTLWERPLTKPGILPVIHDHKIYFREKSVLRIMVSMLPPCPKKSYISGIPSKVRKKKETGRMLKSLGTLPEHSKILGLPAKNNAEEYNSWYLDRGAVLRNPIKRQYGIVHQDFKVMSYRDKEIMLSMLPSCPRQALNPGFPSAPRLQAAETTDAKNSDMVHLLPCCSRQSNIIGFPSRVLVDYEIGGWPVMIIKTQCSCPFYKKDGSPQKDTIKAIFSHEPSCPNSAPSSGFITVPLPDTDLIPNMVNIVPSCPKKGSVLGLPSTHVHHSEEGWPVKTWLVKSGRKTIGKDEENHMSQQLLLEDHSFSKVPVSKTAMHFLFHSLEAPEDGQQSMKTRSSKRSLEAIAKDLPSSNSVIQANHPTFRIDKTEMLWDEASPNRYDLDTKKTSLEMQKDEKGFGLPIEAEEIGALEKGNLHCRMWHSIPDMPLFLSVRKSSLGQKDTQETQISIYEKGDTVDKESTEVTVEDHGFMSSEESIKTLSVESMDVITTCNDTVDQVGVRYSERGHEYMSSQQPSCPIIAGAAEPQSETQINYPEQHLINRTILWEELPKSTTLKCPTDKIIQWVELPKVTTDVTRNTPEEEIKTFKEMVSMDQLLPGIAMTPSLSSKMLDTDDDSRTKTEAGIADMTLICPTVSGMFEFTATAKHTNESLLESDFMWVKPTEDNDSITTESGLHFKGNTDLDYQIEMEWNGRNKKPTAQCMPNSAKPEIEYKQFTSSETYPGMSNIAGVPSKLTAKEEPWLMDHKPFWEKQSKPKEVFQPYALEDVEKNTKKMFLLVPSCPRGARNPGFPSVSHYSLVFCGPNAMDVYPECTGVSYTPDSPPMRKASWVAEQESLLEKEMKTKLVMTVSPQEKDEITPVGVLIPTCPKTSCILGIPLIPQPMIPHHGSDMMSLLRTCSRTSCVEGIPSLMEHLSKKWASDCKPLEVAPHKIDTVIINDIFHNDDMKSMAALAPTCPKEACIPGLPSAMEPTVSHNGFSSVSLLSSCPAASRTAGFPSMQKADEKDWNTSHAPIWEKQIKMESVLQLENNTIDKDMKGSVTFTPSCPRQSVISGFPSLPKPRMINVVNMTNMVSLSSSCSKMSQIPGFPSNHNSEGWTMSMEPLFEQRMKEKKLSLIDECERDKEAIKAMLALGQSCPKMAWGLGFPFQSTVCCAQSISLFTLCPHVSKIPGFPSINGDMNVGWITEKGALLKRLPNKEVIFDITNGYKMIARHMVSCVPSCAKESSIPGFASIPNPQIVSYGLNVVNLLPLCPELSVIPGIPSLERHKEEGWGARLGSLMCKPQTNIHCIINGSQITVDKPNNMFALVPSCPRASKVPGFPSVPHYNMLSIVPVCPKICRWPGLTSFERTSKFQWLFDPHTLCDKLSKETDFQIHCPNQDGKTVKTMLALAPSCPEASRIPGFPSAPQTKPKIEPNMITFLSFCCSASHLPGFASMTTTQSDEWLNETKPILIKPLEKRAKIVTQLAGQDQLYWYNMTSMVTLVTTCPKEARILGFPSAQAGNRPPDMVSLYTSAPCVSCLQGFPSRRMLSADCINKQIRTTDSKSLSENMLNEKMFLIAQHKHGQEDMGYMVAMAPSCPHLTGIPGFPSISQSSPTEKETRTSLFPCSTERHASQELPPVQSTQTYLKDPRIPGSHSTSLTRPSTAPAYGEIFAALGLRSLSPFMSCFSLMYFTVLSFMTEDKFEGGAKHNIDLSADKGKSQVEMIATEDTQTVKKLLDTSEPAGALGWEVLEAEGTVTEKQTESFLSEDTPGLVKAIVGVFHKG
ncbi:uncharacterized protein ehbp1l1a isoform X2 [Acanthopagrus latus]|nr:uncharacterized protein ehbp1l1a isoform X2 [Acanthopagrus latus]